MIIKYLSTNFVLTLQIDPIRTMYLFDTVLWLAVCWVQTRTQKFYDLKAWSGLYNNILIFSSQSKLNLHCHYNLVISLLNYNWRLSNILKPISDVKKEHITIVIQNLFKSWNASFLSTHDFYLLLANISRILPSFKSMV